MKELHANSESLFAFFINCYSFFFMFKINSKPMALEKSSAPDERHVNYLINQD